MFFGEGFVDGLRDSGEKVAEAAANMGKRATSGVHKALDKVKKLFDNPDNYQPVIRPVVDMSDVDDSVKKIGGLFNTSQMMSIKHNIRKASNLENQNDIALKSNGTVYNTFTQNNYSPKALSRIDIYRQTKNQLSAFKGPVKAK